MSNVYLYISPCNTDLSLVVASQERDMRILPLGTSSRSAHMLLISPFSATTDVAIVARPRNSSSPIFNESKLINKKSKNRKDQKKAHSQEKALLPKLHKPKHFTKKPQSCKNLFHQIAVYSAISNSNCQNYLALDSSKLKLKRKKKCWIDFNLFTGSTN